MSPGSSFWPWEVKKVAVKDVLSLLEPSSWCESLRGLKFVSLFPALCFRGSWLLWKKRSAQGQTLPCCRSKVSRAVTRKQAQRKPHTSVTGCMLVCTEGTYLKIKPQKRKKPLWGQSCGFICLSEDSSLLWHCTVFISYYILNSDPSEGVEWFIF